MRAALLALCGLLVFNVPGSDQTHPPAPAVARPSYLIVIDVNSLDAAEARTACILTGAFVDGLDPDDRVAITLSVSNVPVGVDATTRRLTMDAALQSIMASASPGSIVARSPVAGRDDPLIATTTQLLQGTRVATSRFVVVWITNRIAASTGDPEGAFASLTQDAVAARAAISIVIPANNGPASDSYRSLAAATGGIVIARVGSVDAAAETLLNSTAGPEVRRSDPAGVSEMTSLRWAAEWQAAGSACRALVEQYRTGIADAAVSTFLSWSPARVASEIGPLPSVVDLQAAIALHTEAGVRRGLASRLHRGIARRAAKALSSRQQGAIVCRHALLAMSAYSREDLRGVEMPNAGDDAAMMVALGSVPEVPTSLETQPALDRADPPAADLARAADLYRSALAIEPGFAEARLRLGRVLGIQHHTGEAIAHLERARLRTTDARLLYLASLFLGEIQEAAGDSKAATTAYRAAIQSRPDALAARVALARLLQASGRFTEAGQVLREKLSARPVQRPARDPWQEYFRGSPEDLVRELSALRQAVRK